ncbi:hypothetical protein ABHF91_08285 [Pseudaeromonas sp. ZJS20]|uniref:hypothetical protein n=1 Tax=Pseudaeromonas aegiceratis TaxID=3153928 RepID=UPI00390CD98A
MVSWGLLLAGLLLPIQQQGVMAEQSWVTVDRAALPYAPQTQALSLFTQDSSVQPLAVEATDSGWRILFRERIRGPVTLYLDESVPPAAEPPIAATALSSGPSVCYRVRHSSDTLWRAGQSLTTPGGDPYLMVLALFASNKERLGNDPDGLRIGDELLCPSAEVLGHFTAMDAQARRSLYRRLEAYGRRLHR